MISVYAAVLSTLAHYIPLSSPLIIHIWDDTG